MPNYIAKIFFIAAIALLTGCNFTTTTSIEPKFKNGVEAIQPKIESLITCEHITISGIKKTVNSNTQRILEISVLNAQSLPKSNDSLKTMSRQIAMLFKDDLVNRGEFDIYRILFVTQSSNENVQSNYYEEIIFADKEL